MTQHGPTYDGGAEALISQWEVRRAPIRARSGEGLPNLEVDLDALEAKRIVLPGVEPAASASGYAKKQYALMKDLDGLSSLALLNAIVIAHLRKREYPSHGPALFRRIWAEKGHALLAELPTRWLISSAITFASHGSTEADRHLGQSLNLLFSVMKLYEFERQFSGAEPDEAFAIDQRRKSPLPIGMPDFSLASGGLDVNLLAPIWKAALETPAIGPLACRLLGALNEDTGTVFRRLQMMRRAKQAQKAARHQP
jgi:hypothetical protein